MSSWTNATPESTPAGVILRRRELDDVVRRLLAAPSAAASTHLERFWRLDWNLVDQQSFASSLVPTLSMNLTWEEGSGRPGTDGVVVVTGLPSKRFDTDLRGSGSVVGAIFRPGVLPALGDFEAHEVTDRTVPAASLLPTGVVRAFELAAREPEPTADQPERLEAALGTLLDQSLSPEVDRLHVVLEAATDPAVTKVEQLCDAGATHPRGLQRLFRRLVGLPPKQVLERYRLHDAVAALEAGEPLADVAHRLGFFDQAHFTRAFTAFVGQPPGGYLR